jgi:hypothetical protein
MFYPFLRLKNGVGADSGLDAFHGNADTNGLAAMHNPAGLNNLLTPCR